MNRKTLKFTYRIAAALLLSSIFTFAFVLTRSAASEQVDKDVPNQTSIAEAEETTSVYEPKTNAGRETSPVVLKAQKRGFPLINLQDGKRLETKFVGSASATQSFGSAQALTMTNADLNLDGAPDLVVGYASAGGGHLALYAGNPDALSARTAEAFEAIKEGRFPEPFLPEARLIALPAAPDFVGTGDFNRDGWKDIVAAQRGASSLVLLAGNAKGNYKPQTIEMPGQVTALMAENIDPADGQPDVAVALSDTNGAWLFVFDNEHNAFAGQPRMYPLPAEATSLALGQLDDSLPMDILAAAGGKAVVIHGSYADKNESPESQLRANAGQIETLSTGADVAAVRIGHFVWDRENRPEIALLSSGGAIQILKRGTLYTRRYTEEEWETHLRAREEQDQIELQRRSADPTNRAAVSIQRLSKQKAQGWTEADSFQLSSGFNFDTQSPASVFTSTRMTSLGVDDLIVADAGSSKIKVLVQNNEALKATGESYNLSATGELAAIEFDAEGTPAAVLPMRLSVLTRPGLVMLNRESAEVSYAVAAPAVTYNVTKTADTFDGTCDADCSLREAIRAANLTVGVPDVVMVPAGTYTLTIGPADDSPADPSDQDSGDLDIRQDLTITGAGQATTIIQAGATAATGIDRVLHTRQSSLGIPDISISGVTIRHGRCSTAGSVANPNGARCNTGGSGLLHSVDDIADVTISDSTFTTNWNVATNAGTGVFFLNGAGIFIGRGDTVMTNVTISNNENGATGSDNGGDGGGVLFGFSSATETNTAVLNNVTMTGNIARIIGTDTLGGNGGGLNHAYDDVDINGGTYSNNISDLDGGAFYLLTKTDLFGNVSVTGNTAKRDGGGIWSDPLNTDATPATNTVANLTIRNNTADSDGIVHPQFPGDPRGAGGGIYHDRATLTLTTVTIGGTGGSQPNISYDGGGLGHRYRAQASTSNVSTITINGSSILGNIANNDGGGIFHDATRTAGANSTISVAPSSAVTLTDNKAKNNGGGVSNSGGASATLTNMQLRSNQANSDASGGGDGGALYQNIAGSTTTFNGTLTIGGSGFANSAVNGAGIRNNAGTVNIPSSASITHNTATGTGGGISNAGTLSALASATVINNTATGNGGGIHNTGTLGAITSSQFSGNSAATGGGIFSSNGPLSITSGNASGNTATTGKGGGIEHSGTSASTVSSVSILNNVGSGIHITGTGSLDATSNSIAGNSGDGITKIGTGVGSHFNSNVIFNNGELGIDLVDNAVTPNDANDTDTGPNNLQNFPVLNYVRRGDGVGNVTLNAPNGKYRIQYYANTTCDPSGHGEGESLKASQVVDITTGNTLTFFSPALAYGTMEQITATATHDANGNNNFDDDGSTSEFSACRKVNTLPTITPQAGNTRQQGSPVSNTQIAVVADPDQTLNTLVVTVNGGASATVNGVTLSNIVVSAGGFVTADIVASCTATNATFTLRVTDNATEFNEANLTVTVTPNTPPTLGTYPNTTVNAGSSGSIVTPNAAPTDNGTVATLTASAPGFTGTLVGNPTTGTVTVNNAGPAATYTVTVTATDNCGATTTTTFQLTVNAIPTITGATISRQQGSPSSNSQIATVNDNDQAENTLVVTVNGGASATVNGVAVSNIVVDASGNVTADVVASCTATNATFTLTVTDVNGASANGTLTVNVTPNTPPTVGTYATTNLTSGGGTTVTPSAAPADNGSITSATVAASGAFTGTLSVNPTTGVVTISNANPGGSYTISVTYTDNCGATTIPTFTLNVTYTISGTVIYGTTPTGDPVKPVPGVTLNAVGTPPVSTTTTLDGTYTLSGLGSGPYTVTPSKPTQTLPDNNGISFQDASEVAKYVFNLRTFTANELIAADATGNGMVTLQDASEIAKRAANITSTNIVGQWKFVPASRTYPSITANLTGENYDGILVGDVTGNWTPPTADPQVEATEKTATAEAEGETGAARAAYNEWLSKLPKSASGSSEEMEKAVAGGAISVSLPNAQGNGGTTVLIPVTVSTITAGDNVTAYDLTVTFDPLILQPAATPFEFAGTLTGTAGGYSGFVDTSTPSGTLRVGAFGTTPITGSGTLLFLRFNVLAGAAATSPLNFTNFTFGEGTPADVTTNGTFMRLGPTAVSATVTGRILTANGRGISKARVSITNQSGVIRWVLTNSFGYYHFTDVAPGETYIISPKHKQYRFESQVISPNGNLTDINFIASGSFE